MGSNESIETAVVKGFSQKSLFWTINFSPKNAYLRSEQELERIEDRLTGVLVKLLSRLKNT